MYHSLQTAHILSKLLFRVWCSKVVYWVHSVYTQYALALADGNKKVGKTIWIKDTLGTTFSSLRWHNRNQKYTSVSSVMALLSQSTAQLNENS